MTHNPQACSATECIKLASNTCPDTSACDAAIQNVNERLRIEATAHALADEARKESENRLLKIIEHSPMSMAIVGMDGTIEFINRKATETFGYLLQDIPNMDRWWTQAYPDPEYRSAVMARWTGYITEALVQGREIQRDDYRVTCKDGTVKTVTIFGVPVADKVFVMFDDITVRALKEDFLRRSNIELERRVEKRTAELAERNLLLQAEVLERQLAEQRLLQTNLTLGQTTAQLRKLGAKLTRVEEQERRRMAHILHDQLQQMLVSASFSLSLLERDLSDTRLLNTARAASMALNEAIRESKSLVLELSPPVLREGGLAQAMKWIRQHMFEKHGLTVVTSVDEHAGTIGEDLRLTIFQAVRELLLNVVKHSKVTTATVDLAILPEAQVQVVVSDQGHGCTLPAPGQDEQLSPGFGLFAIRERFESLGGRMQIEGASGQGFRVTLIAPITSPAPLPQSEPDKDNLSHTTTGSTGTAKLKAPPHTNTRIRVLLADDHLILRQGLADLLSRDPGIEVVGQAPNGEVALQLARALRPEVVLMDINMPKMNGIESTRALHAEFPDIVIIGLSMHEESHRADEMRQAGAVAYVAKSEATETLVATINACYGR